MTQTHQGLLSVDDIRQLRAAMVHLPSDEPEWSDFHALVGALKRDNMRAVHVLLSDGCRVNKPGTNVHPLHLAVAKLGWYNIVEKLLAVGARVTDRDEKGETALHVAFLNYASDSVIDLLLERYLQETAEDLSNKEGIGFLHIACTRVNVEIIRDFVVRGQGDVNRQVPMKSRSIFAGCTPLHFAAEYGQPGMIRFLLDHNAELYARDCNGSTPLHYALERRDVEIIDLILSYDHRRHENIVNDFGLSHFMAACVGTNEAVVFKFLQVAESQSRSSVTALISDACKNLKYYKHAGYTSMLFASEFGRNKTMEILKTMAERKSRERSVRNWEMEEGRQLVSGEMKAKRSCRSVGLVSNFVRFIFRIVPTYLTFIVRGVMKMSYV